MRINGTLQQRQLGQELRQLREEAGLTLEEAAPRLDWSTSKLNRIENGQQGVDVHGVRSMLDLYDVGGDRWTEIIDLVREARQKGWWPGAPFQCSTMAASSYRGRSPTRTSSYRRSLLLIEMSSAVRMPRR